MVVYTVEVELQLGSDSSHAIVSPICAYTSKKEAEKHIKSLWQDLFGDTYYFWEALEVEDRYEPDGGNLND